MIFHRLLLSALLLLPVALHAGSSALTNLDEAIETATKEDKALFVMYGREACGNCKSLHSLVDKKDVRLPKSSFLIVDLNCDDPATSQAFRSRFKVDGNTLPFVVITKPDGTQVASRSGYGSAAQYNDFIREARKALNK